jgi:hypothetical protein
MNEPNSQQKHDTSSILTDEEIEDLFYQIDKQRNKKKTKPFPFKKELVYGFVTFFLLSSLLFAIKYV